MKKIYFLVIFLNHLFATHEVHININSMHAPFVNCTSPQECTPLIEKLTHQSFPQLFLSYKSALWQYKYGIVLIVVGGGLFLWLKKPVWFKKYVYYSS